MKTRIIILLALVSGILSNCTVTSPTNQTATNSSDESRSQQAIFCKSKFLDNKTSVKIILSIDLGRVINLQRISEEAIINYNQYPDYTNKVAISNGVVPITAANSSIDGQWLIVTFDVPKPKEGLTGVVVSEVKDLTNNRKASTDTFLRFQSGKVSDYFCFFDKNGKNPILRNYINVQDTFQLKSLDGKEQVFRMYHYKHDFDPALSPMATSQRQPSKNLYVDTVFSITTNTPIFLKNEGLYYFSRDTSEAYGIGLISVDGRFPKLTRPEKLTRPLIYMSTSQEMNELLTSKDAKKSLDSYWLNLAQGNQNTAKRTIKSFYKRVDKANQLFTTYKDGWKTDKGMVWIIMGNPQRVVRTREKEIWTYSRSGQFSEINFTFVKRPNQFVEDHYELQRYAEFQSIWYPTVEQWRNGDTRATGN